MSVNLPKTLFTPENVMKKNDTNLTAPMTARRRRNMIDFVEAARELILAEGLDSLSIRKIASVAGYNSATIYNYFEDLAHLTLFGCACYLRDYVLALSTSISDEMTSIDRFRTIYTCFNEQAFRYPGIYHNLFFGPHRDLLGRVLHTYYYDLFPDELTGLSENMRQMLVSGTMYERDKVTVLEMVRDGYIAPEKADMTQELIIAAHQHFIFDAVLMGEKLDIAAHQHRFMVLFEYLLSVAH